MIVAGRLANPRRQCLRHHRQAGPPGDPDGAGEEFHLAIGRRPHVPLPDERLEERPASDAVRRPKGKQATTSFSICGCRWLNSDA